MNYYFVTSNKSKVTVFCNEPTDLAARDLYKSIIPVSKRSIKVSIANTFSYIALKAYEFVLFTNFQTVSDMYAKLDSYRLTAESLKKANAEMHLNCKFLQEQNRRLQAQVQEQEAQILELNKATKSTTKTVKSSIEEQIKTATAKKVKV